MAEHTYLQSRGGTIHVWDGKSPSDKDYWQRAVCGDPGDFWELNPEWVKKHNIRVTCESCMEKLGIPIQRPLPFSKKETSCQKKCPCKN